MKRCIVALKRRNSNLPGKGIFLDPMVVKKPHVGLAKDGSGM